MHCIAVRKIAITLVIATTALCSFGENVDARQFRSIRPMAKPDKIAPNAVPVVRFRRVKASIVRAAVQQIAHAWNTGQLSPMLSREKFFNKDRLLDALSVVVPSNAKLRVVSVGGVTTLQQYFEPRGGRKRQVNIVSAVVNTQLEFHDANNGFVKLAGRNEFVLEIVQ